MNESKPRLEQEPQPKDISNDFLTMEIMEFDTLLRNLRNEPILSIAIEWDDSNPKLTEWTLVRLKAFLETKNYQIDQKRFATVRATEEQKNGPILSKGNCPNTFASGVKWEKVE